MEIDRTNSPNKIRTHRPQLQQEIIEKILPKLPVESLLRFRCVSKSWLSLISNKLFTKTHHQISMKNPSFPHQRVILHNKSYRLVQCSLPSLLLEPSVHHISPFDDPINRRWKPLQVVGSYDGLICILQQPRTFFLWNPSTRISKRLPETPYKPYKVKNYGFGWVESSREYKVFAILSGHDEFPVVVYSSRTRVWKVIGKLRTCLSCEEGVFVDGKLHWDWFERGKFERGSIVSFDLKNEGFDEFKMPFDDMKVKPFNTGLGVVGGCLSVLYYYVEAGIRVWVMKGYGKWEILKTFRSVVELLERPFSTPFIVSPKGEIVLFCGSTFLIYYPRDNVFRCPEIFCRYQSHHLYVESLVSPEEVV